MLLLMARVAPARSATPPNGPTTKFRETSPFCNSRGEIGPRNRGWGGV